MAQLTLTKRFLTIGATALLLFALGLWVSSVYWQPKRAVAKYKHRLRSGGERLTIAEVSPPFVLAESNSAWLFQGGFMSWRNTSTLIDTNPPPAMRLISPGKAMVGASQPALITDGANTWEEAEAFLATEADDLKSLEQLVDRPTLDFQLDYKVGFSLLLPHLSQLKRAAQQLSAAAVTDLHRGDTAPAVLRIRAMLALVKGMHDERLVISQLVRLAIAQITMSANWELLQSTNVPDAQLASVQRDWMELEFLGAGEQALAMERAMAERTLEEMRSSSARFDSILSMSTMGSSVSAGSAWEKLGANALIDMRHLVWRLTWSYPDELRFLQGDQALLESIRSVQSGQSFKVALGNQEARLNEVGIKSLKKDEDNLLFSSSDSDPRSLFSRSVQSLERFMNRLLTVEAARQLTATAISLKRYALKYGEYPTNLVALVPEFMALQPLDPVDGKPLRYHLDSNRTFKLYSIGEDGEDNGGDPTSIIESKTFSWQRGRDWVWPVPAAKDDFKRHYEQLVAKRKAISDSASALSTFQRRYGIEPRAQNTNTNN